MPDAARASTSRSALRRVRANSPSHEARPPRAFLPGAERAAPGKTRCACGGGCPRCGAAKADKRLKGRLSLAASLDHGLELEARHQADAIMRGGGAVAKVSVAKPKAPPPTLPPTKPAAKSLPKSPSPPAKATAKSVTAPAPRRPRRRGRPLVS